MIKPSFDTNRTVLGNAFPLSSPFTVILDTSEICNLKCSYCFRSNNDYRTWGYASEQGLMSWDVFEEALSQLLSFPEEVRQISLSHHGEPLCNKRLPMMIDHIRRRGFKGRISLHTNGSLLTDEYAKMLGKTGFSRIVISIQGLSSYAYEKSCGHKIDYTAFINNIRVLYETKQMNHPEAEIDVKIADVALRNMDSNDFYNMFRDISDRMYIESVVPIWKNIHYNDDQDKSLINKFGTSFPIQKCCRLIFDTIVVLPNGDIYPCTQLIGPPKIGNIFSDSLVSVWNGKERKKLLEGILKLDTPKMCGGCYIGQNSIYANEDMIDEYRGEILTRLNEEN